MKGTKFELKAMDESFRSMRIIVYLFFIFLILGGCALKEIYHIYTPKDMGKRERIFETQKQKLKIIENGHKVTFELEEK